jgi:hypothetical protein
MSSEPRLWELVEPTNPPVSWLSRERLVARPAPEQRAIPSSNGFGSAHFV